MDKFLQNIHDPDFVRDVFDRCAPSYRRWSGIASFGFVNRWRRQCIAALKPLPPNAVGYDLMAGTGEIWADLVRKHPDISKIIAIDISGEMHRRAVEIIHSQWSDKISHIEADALASELPEEQADFVVSSFGLKTLDHAQQVRLAQQIAHVLKPGGQFVLVEACDPRGWWLRPVYRLYLDRILPLIERFILRGAQDFMMLGIYTKAFGDTSTMTKAMNAEGLDTRSQPLFFGCAALVTGMKPLHRPTS